MPLSFLMIEEERKGEDDMNTPKSPKRKKATTILVVSASSSSSSSNDERDVSLESHLSWMGEIWHTMSPCEKLTVLIPYRDEAGRGVLTRATRTGDRTLVRKLLAMPGVLPNTRDVYGNTALHHAALCKHEEVVLLLITSKLIDSTVANHGGATAYEIISAHVPDHFSFDTRLLCYTRMMVDLAVSRTIPVKLKEIKEIRRDDRSTIDKTVDYILTLLNTLWDTGEFASEPMPLNALGSETFVREVLMHQYMTLFHVTRK